MANHGVFIGREHAKPKTAVRNPHPDRQELLPPPLCTSSLSFCARSRRPAAQGRHRPGPHINHINQQRTMPAIVTPSWLTPAPLAGPAGGLPPVLATSHPREEDGRASRPHRRSPRQHTQGQAAPLESMSHGSPCD